MLRKQGQLERLRAEVAKCESEIAGLQQTRTQVEAVMRLHEVQVNPVDLRPIRPQFNKAVLGYGGVTRIVFATLRTAKNGTATTREITAAVLEALPQKPDAVQMAHVKERIQVRLCVMATQGKLIKIPQPSPCEPCSWRPATARLLSP